MPASASIVCSLPALNAAIVAAEGEGGVVWRGAGCVRLVGAGWGCWRARTHKLNKSKAAQTSRDAPSQPPTCVPPTKTCGTVLLLTTSCSDSDSASPSAARFVVFFVWWRARSFENDERIARGRRRRPPTILHTRAQKHSHARAQNAPPILSSSKMVAGTLSRANRPLAFWVVCVRVGARGKWFGGGRAAREAARAPAQLSNLPAFESDAVTSEPVVAAAAVPFAGAGSLPPSLSNSLPDAAAAPVAGPSSGAVGGGEV